MDPAASWILRLGMAALLGAAAVHKLRDLGAFTETLRDHRILPDGLVRPAAPLVPALELAAAVALLIPMSARAGGLGALCLLAAYSTAIATNLARGRRHIDCGCMGPAHRQPLSGWLLARNALFAAAAVGATMPTTARTLDWVDALSIAGGVCVVALLHQAISGLAALAPSLDRLRGTS
jgi:uncharacterized membrane protein YphA (DoxX/SURF4 family)